MNKLSKYLSYGYTNPLSKYLSKVLPDRLILSLFVQNLKIKHQQQMFKFLQIQSLN